MNATAEKQTSTTAESIEFSAEIAKVLQLMIHSLYTNKDIFLRELISNASDACDKIRYQAVVNDALLADDAQLHISIAFDEKKKMLTIADTGIGMNREDLISSLGTIAKSGTQEFFSHLSGDEKKDMNLIGQFGVGFYSAFMVADRIVVKSRKAGENGAWEWASDGNGSFTVEPAQKDVRGTEISLYLKKDAKEYLDFFRLKHIIQTYSDHIAFPIHLTNEQGESQIVNSASAIWARPKSEITDEQYQEFYRAIAHSPDQPFMTLHNKAEGVLEYTNLLFVPSMKPFDLFNPDRTCRVKLYVKRVFITEEGVELVPAYLRFLRGVIDSQDLPLNISRETLQDNPALAKIRNAVTNKVLSELAKKAKKDRELYLGFWKNFGAVLKEGLCESHSPKDKIIDASLFATTYGEELTSIAEYVERMQPKQKAIYYLSGDDEQVLRHSPQIEGFKKQGIEVLLLTDHVDDFWVNATPKVKEFELKSVVKSGSDLKEGAKDDEAKQDEPTPDVSALCEELKRVYGDAVREVRPTYKLEQSPVCLAVGEGDMELRMERFLLEHKQLPKALPKILEINPDHAIIQWMCAQVASSQHSEMENIAWMLLDQARIQEGEPIADPISFAKRMNEFLVKGLGL